MYPVAIVKGELSLGVRVPDIPGCISGGEDFNDAIESLKEAIKAHIDLLLEDGEPIPDATSINNYLADAKYAGVIWALVDVDITRLMGKSEKTTLPCPRCCFDVSSYTLLRIMGMEAVRGFFHLLQRTKGCPG